MTSEFAVERRAQKRTRVLLSGHLECGNGVSTACIVKNYSEAGARVEFPAGLIFSSELAFSWNRDPAPRIAKVIWRTKNAAGLQFLRAANA